jgi:hypothetical protein
MSETPICKAFHAFSLPPYLTSMNLRPQNHLVTRIKESAKNLSEPHYTSKVR